MIWGYHDYGNLHLAIHQIEGAKKKSKKFQSWHFWKKLFLSGIPKKVFPQSFFAGDRDSHQKQRLKHFMLKQWVSGIAIVTQFCWLDSMSTIIFGLQMIYQMLHEIPLSCTCSCMKPDVIASIKHMSYRHNYRKTKPVGSGLGMSDLCKNLHNW